MKVDELNELSSKFNAWRAAKKRRSERVPTDLLASAKAAIKSHGLNQVRKATGLEHAVLSPKNAEAQVHTDTAPPSFSRLNIATPFTGGPQPLAEIEAAHGAKLRVFALSVETIALLSALYRGPA